MPEVLEVVPRTSHYPHIVLEILERHDYPVYGNVVKDKERSHGEEHEQVEELHPLCCMPLFYSLDSSKFVYSFASLKG